MKQKDIDQIRKLYSHYGEPHQRTAVYHIRLLLEEIDRLREFEWMYKQLSK